MQRFRLKREHPDGNNFDIDVSNYSFVELVVLLKERAILGGTMYIINDEIRFMVDNGKFFGCLQNLDYSKRDEK